jgi:hypothetical protein
MKRGMFIFFGVCWLGFALAIGIISWPYLAGGPVGDSGFFSQLFAITSGSILLGLARVVGFAALTLLCVAIGLNLLLHGLYPEQTQNQDTESQKLP